MYVNGDIQTTEDWKGPNTFNVSPKMVNPEIITIGRDSYNQGNLDNSKIDDFRFYTIALTEEEVASVFAGDPDVGFEKTYINDYHIA